MLIWPSWNRQGSSWLGFFAQVQHLVVALRLDILCILDTKISDFDPATNKIASKLSVYFDNVDFVNSDGQSGGILLFWNSSTVSLNVIFKHNRFIHCHITNIANIKSWVHTFVYAYPAKKMQLDLWNEIETLKPQNDDSWVLMGDFNNVASSEEKIGGRDPNTVYMHNFVRFLNYINVTSLLAEGLPFTWSNNHQDQTIIFEKLDRVVANPSWLQIFPFACVENLPMVGVLRIVFSSVGNQAGNKDFFFCDIIDGGISEIDNDLILAPATMLEVEKTVNSIGSLKAPGPDESRAAGYILRNSDGNSLVAGARRLYSLNAHVLECLALKDGLLAAKRFNHKNMLVEGDLLLVISSLRDLANATWKIKPILCDILHLAHWFDNISFTHIFREANFMTDALANTGHALQCPKIWVDSYPPQAFSTFQLDSSQTGCLGGFSL
ncbi:hypothetical protein ACLB2K_036981 [Fragaria x ananassa]